MCLHVLGCPEHVLAISGKRLCVDKNFAASVTRELKQRLSGNFLFRFFFACVAVYYQNVH